MSKRNLSFVESESDFSSDQPFDGAESNPLGHLLKIIADLPEMRPEKIEMARRHIAKPDDMIDAQMDQALDKVLEELISE